MLVRIGPVARVPGHVVTFKLDEEDFNRLVELSRRLGVTRSDILRAALRAVFEGAVDVTRYLAGAGGNVVRCRYECPFCGRVFHSFRALRAHVHNAHWDERVCPVCGHRARDFTSLSLHVVLTARRDPAHRRLAAILGRRWDPTKLFCESAGNGGDNR